HVIQLFDTWIGEMPLPFFTRYYLPILNRIFNSLKEEKMPTIYFTKNSQHLWGDFSGLTAEGFSVDSLVPLSQAEAKIGKRFFLQGNLDPVVLLKGTEALVRKETRKLVEEAKKLSKPAILNLGHGILPQTPFENAKAFLQEARALW